MAGLTAAGEQKAWEILATQSPEDIARRAIASYDGALGTWTIRSFGRNFTVSPRSRTIISQEPGSDVLLGKLGDFFRLSALWYLVHAKDVPPTGRLVKLQHISGGDALTKGSHVLPLDKLAQRHGSDREGFLIKSREAGGEASPLADAGIVLHPLPRLPVTLTLWLADDEFPARADLLFDSTCELHAPPDVLWSIAMMTVLIMF
jgi:hypothetical protein